MTIKAPDTYATNFDRMDYSTFEHLGKFTKYPRTPLDLIIERSKDSEAIITNKIKFNEKELDQLPKLRYIGIFATGTDCVNLKACKARNIAVANVPAYSTDSVAQHVIAFILNYSSRIAEYDGLVKEGRWANSPDFCFYENPISELSGKTLGILGQGAIGSKVAQIAAALGMEILFGAVPGRDYNTARTDFDTLLKRSDFLSLHCPATDLTRNIINTDRLSKMKKSAVLINTARGALVDEDALFEALESRTIAHACLDVLSSEPPLKNNKLQFSKHCTLTPHIAWGTREARVRLKNEAAENLKVFIAGGKRNRVDL